MIVGPDFIWLHFPKCGGVAIEQALRTLLAGRSGVAFDNLRENGGHWHHSIEKRQRFDPSFDPSNRRIICGFRRLPFWLLSRIHYEAQRSGRIATREMLLRGEFYEARGKVSKAERYARSYSLPRVDSWIRTENAVADLAAAFGFDVERVRVVMKHRNESRFSYIQALPFWFTSAELAALYAANPTWTAIEEQIYGNILTDPQDIPASGSN